MHVVEHQHHRRRVAQRLDERADSLGGRPARSLEGAPRVAEGVDPLDRAGNVAQQVRGVLVEVIECDPRERSGVDVVPLRDRRRLAMTCRRLDHHEVARVRIEQPLHHGLARDDASGAGVTGVHPGHPDSLGLHPIDRRQPLPGPSHRGIPLDADAAHR